MNFQKRRAIAYIVGCLISSKQNTAIYDYETSSYSNFSGEVSLSNINIYDYDRQKYLTATGTADNFSIYDY